MCINSSFDSLRMKTKSDLQKELSFKRKNYVAWERNIWMHKL